MTLIPFGKLHPYRSLEAGEEIIRGRVHIREEQGAKQNEEEKLKEDNGGIELKLGKEKKEEYRVSTEQRI